MVLQQFDYIFALGTIFAFLDAWNIGANDVANSFATSVSSRSITYLQAMAIASVMEFAGRYGHQAHRSRLSRIKAKPGVNVGTVSPSVPVLQIPSEQRSSTRTYSTTILRC